MTHPAMTGPASLLRPGDWIADPAACSLTFAVQNFRLRTVTGLIPLIGATVHVGPGGYPASIRAELDAAGIDTGHSRRDRDLRGKRFLAAERWPVITFEADDLRPGAADDLRPGAADDLRPGAADDLRPGATDDLRPGAADDLRPGAADDLRPGATAWTVTGTLTVKDARCPVRLDVAGFTIPADGAAVDLRATGRLDRRSAGVTAAPGFFVGHLISLSLAVRLCPPAAAPARTA